VTVADKFGMIELAVFTIDRKGVLVKSRKLFTGAVRAVPATKINCIR
jgi:hypothetical protein